MKKKILFAVLCFCLCCFSVPAYAQENCENMQEYIGFMRQLASGLKAREGVDDSAAIGDKLNDLIGFLRDVYQRTENTDLSKSLDNLEKVWLNQSFDTTNRTELGVALEQSADDLQAIYAQICKQ